MVVQFPQHRRWMLIATSMVILAWAVPTRAHVERFRADQSLWTYEYERQPGNILVLRWLMQDALVSGRLIEAAHWTAGWIAREEPGNEQAMLTWMAKRMDVARDPTLVKALDEDLQRVAAGQPPNEGTELGIIYAALSTERRADLMRSGLFVQMQGWSAAQMGRFEEAERILLPLADSGDLLAKAASAQYVLVLVQQGRWADLRRYLQARDAGNWVLDVLPSNDTPSTPATRAAALLGLEQNDLAARVVKEGLTSSPTDPELLRLAEELALEH